MKTFAPGDPGYAVALKVAARNPAYRKFFPEGTVFPETEPVAPAPGVVSLAVLPCARGDPLTAAEAKSLGKDPRKTWKRCSHPDQPKGEIVCPCTGCGPKCPGYAAESPGIG